MLLNDNNNLIKKVTFFYDSKNTNMAGPPSSQSELSYEHTYMIIMQSLKETIDSIKILTDIAQDCGLSINKAKSNILIYNSKEQPEHIEGIPVTNKMNYLGVTVLRVTSEFHFISLHDTPRLHTFTRVIRIFFIRRTYNETSKLTLGFIHQNPIKN